MKIESINRNNNINSKAKLNIKSNKKILSKQEMKFFEEKAQKIGQNKDFIEIHIKDYHIDEPFEIFRCFGKKFYGKIRERFTSVMYTHEVEPFGMGIGSLGIASGNKNQRIDECYNMINHYLDSLKKSLDKLNESRGVNS